MEKIRNACCNDIDKIIILIKESFSKEIISSIIYGCKGIDLYIREQILIPGDIADTKYIVAENNGVVVGVIELRIQKYTIFLNYICVSINERANGLGSRMLYHAIDIVRKKDDHLTMSLDVFFCNSIARKWYEGLGFSTEYYFDWWSIPLVVDEGDSGYISGYPQAVKCYNEWGFSQFTITTLLGQYLIGILGINWFRVTDPLLLSDKSALLCLKKINYTRTILGIFQNDINIYIPEYAKKICCSLRMNINIDELLYTLKKRVL